jgi:hypothetical protein
MSLQDLLATSFIFVVAAFALSESTGATALAAVLAADSLDAFSPTNIRRRIKLVKNYHLFQFVCFAVIAFFQIMGFIHVYQKTQQANLDLLRFFSQNGSYFEKQ